MAKDLWFPKLRGTFLSVFNIGKRAEIRSSNLTALRTFDLPDSSGTLAIERGVGDLIFSGVSPVTSPGVGIVQQVGQSFSTVNLNSSIDPLNQWNPTDKTYNVITSGRYLITSKVKLADAAVGNPSGVSYGQSCMISNSDGPEFMWFQTAGNRNSSLNTYIGYFNAGEKLRLVVYIDYPSNLGINAATLQIVRL